MRRESHVRFCEGGGVKAPSATRRNVYVCSLRAGERVMASVERFLERRLKRKVNRAKSAVAGEGLSLLETGVGMHPA